MNIQTAQAGMFVNAFQQIVELICIIYIHSNYKKHEGGVSRKNACNN